MDWSWQLNPFTTPEALDKRERWERVAPNEYQLPDMQVLAFIDEIRTLRLWIDTRPAQSVVLLPPSSLTQESMTLRQIRKRAARQSD